jgi:hypothetical protein
VLVVKSTFALVICRNLMAMKDIPVFGCVVARFAVEATAVSDNGCVARSGKVAVEDKARWRAG